MMEAALICMKLSGFTGYLGSEAIPSKHSGM
jgi:hypothetical protein